MGLDADYASERSVMSRLINGYMISCIINAAAKLGIADHVGGGGKTSDELAALTSTQSPQLGRLLKALVGIGVLSVDESGKFGLTRLGTLLLTHSPGSMRDRAILIAGEEHYRAWGNIMHTLETGETAFDDSFGSNLWNYLSSNPERASVFDRGMASGVGIFLANLAKGYPFGDFGTVVDVGGGDGTLMISILKAHPLVRGVVFDQPHGVERARARISAEGLQDRCEAIGGSFLGPIPKGGDVYILSRVVHDWNDEASLRILRNCREAMGSGKLLVVERLSLSPSGSAPENLDIALSDLNMMAVTGGRERMLTEYQALLGAAGLRITRIIPIGPPFTVMESVSR